MAPRQGGHGYMGIAIMALEVTEDAVYVVLGGVGNLVEGGGRDMSEENLCPLVPGHATESQDGQYFLPPVPERYFLCGGEVVHGGYVL